MGFYKPRPTLAELYDEDNTIFSGLLLPPTLQLSILRPIILQELGDLDTVFTAAEDIKAYLPMWSAARLDSWQRMLDALSAEYNPIHNYDRTDTETENVTGSGTETSSGSDKESSNDTQNSSFTGTTQAGGRDTVTRNVQGYNSSAFVPSDQDVTALGNKQDSSSATTGAGTQNRESSRNEDRSRTDTEIRSRTLNSAGNIGVTTSQQMITAEVEMRQKWTVYGIICEAFKHDLCVGVW